MKSVPVQTPLRMLGSPPGSSAVARARARDIVQSQDEKADIDLWMRLVPKAILISLMFIAMGVSVGEIFALFE